MRNAALSLALTLLASVGCTGGGSSTGQLEQMWGTRGAQPGELYKPRAIAIDDQDQLYLVDKTGRIQVFSRKGEFLRGWRTPEVTNGKSCGLSFDNDGNLLVADTHYFRVLAYTPQGKLLPSRTIGGTCGHGPGEFNFVTEVVQDSRGCFYVAEYGEHDRIQKFSPQGKYLYEWGGHGREPGKFVRPNSMAIDENDHLWVADSCNHRIQVFDATGDSPKRLKIWGEEGAALGQLNYPYDLALDGKGHVYVCEFGNHRVQKFTTEGESLGAWGVSGREKGCLFNPWALALDSWGHVHVLDTYNHRVQRITL